MDDDTEGTFYRKLNRATIAKLERRLPRLARRQNEASRRAIRREFGAGLPRRV